MRNYFTAVLVDKTKLAGYLQELQDPNPGFEVQSILVLDEQNVLVIYKQVK